MDFILCWGSGGGYGTRIDILGIVGYVLCEKVGVVVHQVPYTTDPNIYQGKGRLTGRSMDIARLVLLEPELSYQSVAGRFGVSRQRVGAIVRRMGVARRRRPDGIE